MFDRVQTLNYVKCILALSGLGKKILFIVTITVTQIMTVLLLLLPTPTVISSKEKQNVLEHSV